jgi:hypothetical protein
MQDIPDLLETLRRAPKILSQFVQSIPENKLDLRRGEGFWTVAEHLSHLAQVQPMLLHRLERFANEECPEFIPYLPPGAMKGPDTPPRMDIKAALDEFEHNRTRQLQFLENAEGTLWKKRASHPEYDEYSFYILTRHILMHDHWHMYRMEELWLMRDAFLTRLD